MEPVRGAPVAAPLLRAALRSVVDRTYNRLTVDGESFEQDFQIRMKQFFDHYLKDAPAPVWMVEGVPAVMKGKTLGLELVDGTGGGDGKSGG